ncbi:hypothetical protein K450DRAFT_249716 [Umbelopsis ramanniana AG]|uniref:Uncharacterized protein n=1 Tax=Umbelopsis ramanniana AG TaxID=1314678 RepID=A0AAD5E6P1_UMBRA|nr:uncharacterized protein K450DRAFT_249716 [Umbelopsis ramanniana AG]KAI8577882.1 hypothetical protein K450DRAFT_249716 [Umbelopsis ramanniana AG]
MLDNILDLNGPWFYEPDTKRTVLLRGVNLSGGAKLPNGIPTHAKDGYWVDYDRNVNFIGRPMPLEDADEHLGRIKQWGFNFLRFVIIWEAIEHEGPGIYDTDYIEYIIQLLYKCKEYDLRVFIDPHQDCWSRQCGGSGAPGWTLSLVGLNPSTFQVTGAAIVQNVYENPDTFPAMIWSTNYGKLATSTMFTLFFGGKLFAPNCIVDDLNIQDYLQQHFINAVMQVVHRIHKEDSHLENVLVTGYDTINEPNEGYIELADITKFRDKVDDLKKGWTPTAYQGFLLGSGIATQVEEWDMTWSGPKKQKTVLVDPQGVQAWLSEEDRNQADKVFGWTRSSKWQPGCIWAAHGVWDRSQQTPEKLNYFAVHPKTGEPIEFNHLWMDHIQKFGEAIRSVHSEAILFVQPTVLSYPPEFPSTMKRLAYVPHWYDGLTLVQKTWKNYNVDVIGLKRGKYGNGPLKYARALRVGEKSIRKCFQEQLGTLQHEGRDRVGEYPCLLGEIGIPYDMNRVSPSSSSSYFSTNFIQTVLSYLCLGAFRTSDDEEMINNPASPQNRAMDACLNALEGNLLNYTLWTYVPDNSRKWGDRWCGEDLSLWQRGHDGTNARDIPAIHRPHPRRTAGVPKSIESILATEKQAATFKYSCIPTLDTKHPTEIYVPETYFPAALTSVTVSTGTWEVGEQTDNYWIIHWRPVWSEEACTITLTGVTFNQSAR